jgi:hypothetical protein
MHGRPLLLWQQLLLGCPCGGCDVGMAGLEQVHPRSVMDQVRGVWTRARTGDQRSTPRPVGSESGMAAMDGARTGT